MTRLRRKTGNKEAVRQLVARQGAQITIVFLWSLSALAARAEDKINYADHILPLIEANCSKCHNSDKKKADLDLTSYSGALKGSGSGLVLLSGNAEGSKLWKAITHGEEPFMPPNRPKLNAFREFEGRTADVLVVLVEKGMKKML